MLISDCDSEITRSSGYGLIRRFDDDNENDEERSAQKTDKNLLN